MGVWLRPGWQIGGRRQLGGRQGASCTCSRKQWGGGRPGGQDGGRGGEKVIRDPSLDLVPEAVHASECSVVWGEEVGTVGEYGEEEAIGNTMAEERSDSGPWGGEVFDEGEDGLGWRQPVPKVVGRVEGGGELVS